MYYTLMILLLVASIHTYLDVRTSDHYYVTLSSWAKVWCARICLVLGSILLDLLIGGPVFTILMTIAMVTQLPRATRIAFDL